MATSGTSTSGKIDTKSRNRGVWLVKVPKYLSQRWQAQAGCGEVGRLKVAKTKGKSEVTFHLNRNAPLPTNAAGPSSSTNKVVENVPEVHNFIIGTSLNQQTLAILSEDKTDVDEPEVESGKLVVEGRVVQRAECRPPPSEHYMKMKITEIQKVNQPEKTVKQMDKAVVKYKPIAHHAEAVQAQKLKKEGKNVRLEKQQLMELIFQAFEKHQYYKLVDLARLTAQPPTYVKDVLQDIGQYNTGPTNRYTWELKPEYRHYKGDTDMDTS